MYRTLIKPLFFLMEPEQAHYFAMRLLKWVTVIPGIKSVLKNKFQVKDKSLERTVFGLHFPNPIGLAAGFDKDARWIDELDCLGFGFIEIGTLTPVAQNGNDKPRLFRLPKDAALINRMGFNNRGAASAVERLKKRKSKVIVGGNIGKNKVTENDDALSDYIKCFHELFDHVDYFVVNVSSPNTPGLRALQEKEPLMKILNELKVLNSQKKNPKPILLKIAPDLTDQQLDDIIEIVLTTKIDGVIATNTTISRKYLITSKVEIEAIGAGGISGKPLTSRSTEVIRYLVQNGENKFPVIGVGGIHSASDAREKLDAGAALLQVYTGFIYEGPGIAKEINSGLIKRK